jgi:hypothetical protein
MRAPKRHRVLIDAPTESKSVADLFKELLRFSPSERSFHTTANRECGSCHAIKAGSEFDVPITPGRPDLNVCRKCRSGHPTRSETV